MKSLWISTFVVGLALVPGCAVDHAVDPTAETIAARFGVTRWERVAETEQRHTFVGRDAGGVVRLVAVFRVDAEPTATATTEPPVEQTDDDAMSAWTVGLPADLGWNGTAIAEAAAESSIPRDQQAALVRALLATDDLTPQGAPKQPPRKYGARQSCDDGKLKVLHDAKDVVCNVKRSCAGRTAETEISGAASPCAEASVRFARNRSCLLARQRIDRECFYNVSDKTHWEQRTVVAQTGNVCANAAVAICGGGAWPVLKP